jgi:hypothetical protein
MEVMMKLELNREFALRYLFVAVLMLGMGGWFGYDGYVKYPSMTATELYASHHGGKAADSEAAAIKHQQQAIPRQKQFMTLCLVASALVALVLIKAARMRFSYDDEGFEYKSLFIGIKYSFTCRPGSLIACTALEFLHFYLTMCKK